MKTANHKKWLDELTLELRLNNATGKEIGDALAAVEEFVADSGQSPAEAFGTAREYAARLAAESGPAAKDDLRFRITWAAASLVTFLVFSNALSPWIKGELLLVGGVQLASLALMAALVFAMPLYLPYVLRHFWALIALPVVGAAFGLIATLLAPKSPAQAFAVLEPVPVMLASAGILIILSIVGTFVALREPSDPIVSPLNSAPPATAKARFFELLTQWLFPLFSLLLLGFTLLIETLS